MYVLQECYFWWNLSIMIVKSIICNKKIFVLKLLPIFSSFKKIFQVPIIYSISYRLSSTMNFWFCQSETVKQTIFLVTSTVWKYLLEKILFRFIYVYLLFNLHSCVNNSLGSRSYRYFSTIHSLLGAHCSPKS